MKGRILGNSCNKFFNFIAETGTSVAIIPRSLAERNKLQVEPAVPDKPEYEGAMGLKFTVVGQIKMFIKFKIMKNTKVLRAIVCEEESNEILFDLDTFLEWNIIPKCFSLLIDPRERVRNVKVANDIPKKMVDIEECVGS